MPPEASGVALVPLVVESEGQSWTFDRPFTVGRVAPADVVLDNARVSRRHLEVAPHDGGWRLTDVGSANGTFADAEQITSLVLEGALEVQVGKGGPFLKLSLGDPSSRPILPAGPPRSRERSLLNRAPSRTTRSARRTTNRARDVRRRSHAARTRRGRADLEDGQRAAAVHGRTAPRPRGRTDARTRAGARRERVDRRPLDPRAARSLLRPRPQRRTGR